jgi:hypothetical protein
LTFCILPTGTILVMGCRTSSEDVKHVHVAMYGKGD